MSGNGAPDGRRRRRRGQVREGASPDEEADLEVARLPGVPLLFEGFELSHANRGFQGQEGTKVGPRVARPAVRNQRGSPRSAKRGPAVGSGRRPAPRAPEEIGRAPSAPRLHRAFSVGLAGIEPATSALSVLRSNRLSYSPVGSRSVSRGPRPPWSQSTSRAVQNLPDTVPAAYTSPSPPPRTGAADATVAPSSSCMSRTPVASRPWEGI